MTPGPGPGVEPGPHWWEASALTTAPSLLPAKQALVACFEGAWTVSVVPLHIAISP